MIPTPAALAGELTVDEIVASLLAAETTDEVQRCAGAVITGKHVHAKVIDRDGLTVTLSAFVAGARSRIRAHEQQLADLQQTAAFAHGGDVQLAYLHTFPRA